MTLNLYEEAEGNKRYESFPRADARMCFENDPDIDDFKPLTNRPKVTKSMKVFPE